MKTRKQILMLLLVMLAGIPTLSAQTKKEKKEQKKEAVRQLIVSEDYKIDVNTAMPMRGRSIPLTSQYSLQIRNDSVFSYLPYYGRAYSVPYGGGSGLIFNAPLKEYTMDMDKKGNAIIKFSARSPEDFFEFRAKVFPDGTTSIDVTMQNRQAISYRGEVDLDKKENLQESPSVSSLPFNIGRQMWYFTARMRVTNTADPPTS